MAITHRGEKLLKDADCDHNTWWQRASIGQAYTHQCIEPPHWLREKRSERNGIFRHVNRLVDISDDAFDSDSDLGIWLEIEVKKEVSLLEFFAFIKRLESCGDKLRTLLLRVTMSEGTNYKLKI